MYGPQLRPPAFVFAGHGAAPGTILAACPALEQMAAARDAAAAAATTAAAAALGGAAARLLASYPSLGALVAAVAELDVLAGFAAVTDAAAAPPGVAWSRPTFVTAAAAGVGAAGGGTPLLHFQGLW